MVDHNSVSKDHGKPVSRASVSGGNVAKFVSNPLEESAVYSANFKMPKKELRRDKRLIK